MEFLLLCLPIVFAVLFFLNGVTLLEKLKHGRSIRNEKIVGCVWIVLFFVAVFFVLAAVNVI